MEMDHMEMKIEQARQIARRIFAEGQLRCQTDVWTFNSIQLENLGIFTSHDRDMVANQLISMFGNYMKFDPRKRTVKGGLNVSYKDGYHMMHYGPPTFDTPGVPLSREGEKIFNDNVRYLATCLETAPDNYRCFDTEIEGYLYLVCMRDGDGEMNYNVHEAEFTAQESIDDYTCVNVRPMPMVTYLDGINLFMKAKSLCPDINGKDFKKASALVEAIDKMWRTDKISYANGDELKRFI